MRLGLWSRRDRSWRIDAQAPTTLATSVRKARQQTQTRVAQELGINQENVSRIEKRTDLLISTLNGYVEAMGGRLRLVAEFPDRPPITLSGIGALDSEDSQ